MDYQGSGGQPVGDQDLEGEARDEEVKGRMRADPGLVFSRMHGAKE